MNGSHERWMQEALAQAQVAFACDEVPVGAVVVQNGRCIGTGYNQRHTQADPLAHAEVLALREAAQTLGHWRLDDATLYVTLEPCPMCAGALVQARISRVVFGAFEPKMGAVRSLYQLCDDPRAPHRLTIVGGVCEDRCAALLRAFFMKRRASSDS